MAESVARATQTLEALGVVDSVAWGPAELVDGVAWGPAEPDDAGQPGDAFEQIAGLLNEGKDGLAYAHELGQEPLGAVDHLTWPLGGMRRTLRMVRLR